MLLDLLKHDTFAFYLVITVGSDNLHSILYLVQGITVKALRNGENTERIIVARILSGGLVDTFGERRV